MYTGFRDIHWLARAFQCILVSKIRFYVIVLELFCLFGIFVNSSNYICSYVIKPLLTIEPLDIM